MSQNDIALCRRIAQVTRQQKLSASSKARIERLLSAAGLDIPRRVSQRRA